MRILITLAVISLAVITYLFRGQYPETEQGAGVGHLF